MGGLGASGFGAFTGHLREASMGRDRFAQQLLGWEWRGLQLQAEISAARYFVRGDRHEIITWCEVRDVGGGRRCDIGSFPSVTLARAYRRGGVMTALLAATWLLLDYPWGLAIAALYGLR
jgi:hypothetical protein